MACNRDTVEYCASDLGWQCGMENRHSAGQAEERTEGNGRADP